MTASVSYFKGFSNKTNPKNSISDSNCFLSIFSKSDFSSFFLATPKILNPYKASRLT